MGRAEPHPAAPADGRVRRLEAALRAAHDPAGPLTHRETFTNNLSVPRAEWQALGGFDERFPPGTGYEDMDFAYRAVRSGARIVACPGAVAYHNHPLTIGQYFAKARRYQQSAALLFRKHPELRAELAHLRDKAPIYWRGDEPGLVARKALRRLLALPPVLAALEGTAALVERAWPSERLLRFLDWKIVGSYQLIGFREGLSREAGGR
jgi:GT2 family glycosyltransferase